ncbi:MAG: DEAD/DEAH box helicase family protein [Campylobacterales bacterium]|nr:DEAD/DEAH box helicase family protein [Campylobacterales bacterium]MBN2832183.1 DEAD/DEAH box helicase family protein [Campylobacterales bacterium]
MALLFEEIESAFKFVPRPELPFYINENLKHDLREYQTKALQNFLFYLTNQNYAPVKPKHLLFHMATGSGKTMLIASTILELYARGYRNFLFFVNTQNIILKTKENLANALSAKYLFKPKITIHAKEVSINLIQSSFEEAKESDINLFFTTVQGLHVSLTTLKENGITYSDFKDKKLVLIADEAHHLDNENDNERTWWKTVQTLLKTNSDNILLEFTATARLNNHYYDDKIIYDYPLKKFREDKYSKEVSLLSSNFSIYETLDDKALRMLQAIMISEYRKIIAEKHGIALKPVVMFKSKSTKQADENYALFCTLIEKLEPKHVTHILEHSKHVSIIAKMHETLLHVNDFTSRLKHAFDKDKTVLIYGTSADKEVTLKNLNEMEAPHNHIRAIFAVEILNEGWDVLNLFDIVKLDEAPQKKNTTTTKEAQLIGRGARYYPFSLEGDERYKRKFDNDLSHELRMLEEMMFHSINENRYIKVIKEELTKSGIADFDEEDETTVTMRLKESFKTHPYFLQGGIAVNQQKAVDKSNFDGIRSYIPNFGNVNPVMKCMNSAVLSVGFDENETEATPQNGFTCKLKIGDISPFTLRSGLNKLDFFHFANLKKFFPKLKSIDEFLSHENYLGNLEWNVQSDVENPILSEYEKRHAFMKVLENTKKEILKNDRDFEGSREFFTVPLRERLRDVPLKTKLKPNAKGLKHYEKPLDVSVVDWYVFDENYGTSEEMEFIHFLNTHINDLKNKYEDIKLIRNEKAYWIYSFENNGRRFEPDFILLLTTKEDRVLQVFIEPKGEQLRLLDAWKESFLQNLAELAVVEENEGLLVDKEHLKIIGLPFYTYQRENEFKEAWGKTL